MEQNDQRINDAAQKAFEHAAEQLREQTNEKTKDALAKDSQGITRMLDIITSQIYQMTRDKQMTYMADCFGLSLQAMLSYGIDRGYISRHQAELKLKSIIKSLPDL